MPLVNYFEGRTSAECHASIASALRGRSGVRNFLSVVESAEYVHPSTLEWRGQPASIALVESAYRALEPHVTEPASSYARRSRGVRGRELRYQLEHGSRIFQSTLGLPCSSPFEQALRALTSSAGGRRSYVGLFRTEIDASPNVQVPPPGLVGLQFVLDSPTRLSLVASFRHIELSFWWGVNVLEMGRLLMRGIREAGLDPIPVPGTITFFAAMAGWEEEPDLVACADIDLVPTDELARTVAAAMMGHDDHSIETLRDWLSQKLAFTNIANIETIGVQELAGLMKGLASVLRPRRLEGWLAVAEQLRLLVVALDAAIVGRASSRQDHIDEAFRSGKAALDGLRAIER